MTLNPAKDPSCVLAFDWGEGSGNTVYDLSQYSNNGTIYGAVRTRGILRYAGSFDAVDDRIVVPHNDLLNIAEGNKITIETWAYLTGWQEGRLVGVLIDKRTEDTANYNWEFYDKFMIMRIHAEGTKWIISIPHSLFRWNHYVMVLDGSWLGGYLNGELKAERDDVPPSSTNTEDLHICESIWGTSRMKGLIGSLRLYNRALKKKEIKEHYYYGISMLKQKIPSKYVYSPLKI